MNATRAASIRLRAAFDGAVSLGPRADAHARAGRPPRGGDPQLRARALLARGGALRGDRGAPLHRPLPGRQAAAERGEAQAIVDAVRGQAGEITKLEKTEQREQPQLLYDLTSLQRHANSLYGFSARRTLSAAQRLYEDHKALTYPRTNSRFLTGTWSPRSSRPRSTWAMGAQYEQRRSTCSASTRCRSAGSSTTPRSRTTTRSSPRTPTTTCRRWARTS